MAKRLLQYHPRVERDFFVLVTLKHCEKDIGFRGQVLYGRIPGTNLPT